MFAAAPLKKHRVEGIVVEIDRAQGIVVVSHKPIADFMPAMMMPFHADRPSALDALRPGMRIGFELIISGSKARTIRVLDNASVADFKLPKQGDA